MSISTTGRAYSDAWRDRGVLIPLYLTISLLSFAIIAPVIGLLANMAIAASGQQALTDQDIAVFLLSPVGFVLMIAVVSLILITVVLNFTVLTIGLHYTQRDNASTLIHALRLMVSKWRQVTLYAALLVMRCLLIVAPFALIGLYYASRQLGEYDINYYLSNHPPEFIRAVAVGAVLVLIILLILLNRMVAWSVSLHFVLFRDVPAWKSFSASAQRMSGQKKTLLMTVVIWFAIRSALLAGLAALATLTIQLIPGMTGLNLNRALTLVLALAAVWWLLRVLVAAVALGALARILNDAFGPDDQPPRELASVMPRLSLRLLALGTVAVVGFGIIVGTILLERIETSDNVLIIGHRGAAGAKPENTVAAIRQAVEDGADWVEIDVQETADGEVIVIHDSDFMKLAGVNIKVWDATMPDLTDIDIGSWFDPQYSDQRTPTLAEVLEITRDKSRLLIELKYYGHDVALEQRVVDIVEAAGMQDQIATMSLKYPAVQKMKALQPDWPSGVLAATSVGDLTRLEGDFLAVSTAQATTRMVRHANAANKELLVWTVNDPVQMSAMITLGVDGLITDEPALARRVLDQRADLNIAEKMALFIASRLGLKLNTGAYRDASP